MILSLVLIVAIGCHMADHCHEVAQAGGLEAEYGPAGAQAIHHASAGTRRIPSRGLPGIFSEEMMNMEAAVQESVQKILDTHARSRTALIEVLHDIQSAYGYLPEDALKAVSTQLGTPLIEVFRVANFYKAFKLKPVGKHLLTLCMGTACHVRGADKLVDEVAGQFSIQPGETTADGELTLETVNCLGACALGPVAILDGKLHDHVTYAKLRSLLAAAVKDSVKDGAKS